MGSEFGPFIQISVQWLCGASAYSLKLQSLSVLTCLTCVSVPHYYPIWPT